MKRTVLLIIYFFLLLAIVYFKFFNENTAEIIRSYFQLQALLAFLVFYIAIQIIAYASKYIYSKKNKIPAGRKNNVHFGIENIANFTVGVGIFTLFLSLIGINPKELVTTLTIVAAAFVILTKEYIIDFISGIYLSFSNTFEINDYIKTDVHKGKVVEISLLKTRILNDDDDVVIIPNSKVHYSEIINYTKRDARLMTIDFQIALKYISNIEQLEKEIISALKSFKEYIEPKSYNLKVVEMKMDHLDVKFQYTLKLVDRELQRQIRKKTIREVFNFISSKKDYLSPGKQEEK